MVGIRLEVDTPLSPQQVRAAATDFSKRRPQIWSGIDPKRFTVHALGDRTAEVTEGGREFGGSGLGSGTTGPTRTRWSPGYWTPTSSPRKSVRAAGPTEACRREPGGVDLAPPAQQPQGAPRGAGPQGRRPPAPAWLSAADPGEAREPDGVNETVVEMR